MVAMSPYIKNTCAGFLSSLVTTVCSTWELLLLNYIEHLCRIPELPGDDSVQHLGAAALKLNTARAQGF